MEDTKRGFKHTVLGTLPKPNKQHSPSVSHKYLFYFSDQSYTIHYGHYGITVCHSGLKCYTENYTIIMWKRHQTNTDFCRLI